MTAPYASFRSFFIDINGSRRNVLEWGDPNAPAVVLQHGMRDHAHSWRWVAERLQDRYHVLAPDLRGHGDSDWSPDGNYALPGFVIDLAEIVAALKLRTFDLVGHSLGGHITLQYAATFPEKITSLFLIECIELPLIRAQRADPKSYPVLLRAWADEEMMRRTQSRRFYPTLAEAQARMAAANPDIDEDTVADLARTGVMLDSVRGFRWKYDPACRLRAPQDQNGADLDEILAAVACPTLLVYGDDSWIPHPPADRLARLKNHRLATFAGASHWLHHQRRDAFCKLLDTFLADPVGTISIGQDQHA